MATWILKRIHDGNNVIKIGTRQDRYVSMRGFSNHAVLSMSDSTMAVSSKFTQDLSVQIVFFTFSCKWFLCFYLWAVIWSYIVDLFAGLHELASASSRTLLKLTSSVRTLLKPYGDTLKPLSFENKNLRYQLVHNHFVNNSKSSIEEFSKLYLQKLRKS